MQIGKEKRGKTTERSEDIATNKIVSGVLYLKPPSKWFNDQPAGLFVCHDAVYCRGATEGGW